MVLDVVKAARYFCQVSEISIHSLELSAEKICLRAPLRPCPSSRHGCHNNAIYNVGFWIAINLASGSKSESLKCRQGFHSSTNMSSINFNEKSDIEEPTSISRENTCSTSVQSTPDIEKKYVHRVYDAIAPHFSSTRFAKWPKVAGFLNSLKPGSFIVDAGCGNGKYLGFYPDCFYIGCDISPPLIDICARKGHEVIVADAVNLPYRMNVSDAAISIAVLHHLSTESRRRKAIEELVRVVRRGGLVLITVWAVEQEDKALLKKWTPLCHKYNEEWTGSSSPPVHNPSAIILESIPETDDGCLLDVSQSIQAHKRSKDVEEGLKENIVVAATVSSGIVDGCASYGNAKTETHQEYFVPWHLPYHRAETSSTSASALANGLAKKDDKKGAMVYNRYYHVFNKGELERLVSGMDNAAIIEQFYDKSNWCIVLQKT